MSPRELRQRITFHATKLHEPVQRARVCKWWLGPEMGRLTIDRSETSPRDFESFPQSAVCAIHSATRAYVWAPSRPLRNDYSGDMNAVQVTSALTDSEKDFIISLRQTNEYSRSALASLSCMMSANHIILDTQVLVGNLLHEQLLKPLKIHMSRYALCHPAARDWYPAY
jgi:hypothetical protein